ncbi:MAG: NADH-quinone oxidoreductase subunit L [Thermomicrobiales bacterium]
MFLIPLLPLLAAIVNYVFGRSMSEAITSRIATVAVGGSFALSLAAFGDQLDSDEPIRQHLYDWIPAGLFHVPLNLHVDHLTAIMLLVVTSVSLLVHIYSAGYMHGDPGFYRFFSFLPLFVFSMLMLVLADNFLVLFFGWEAVGLCSYLLIGFYFKRHSANQAAKKAFIVNRIGDFGFATGIMLIFWKFDTVIFEQVFSRLDMASGATLTLIVLLLFTGAAGKSAQLPLFVWLPDAMEGPTPVSALIHAATMVTAGIYMMARMYPIVSSSSDAMFVIALIGAITAFIAGSIALTQFDIKRVIAYSTVSHLGFMAFAIGVGAWVAAIFHLFTHAFFKGLLFLGSGSVIHGMHEEQDMRNMGGLRKYMPTTHWTFAIAAASNAGIFIFAGFWSKDEVLVGGWLDERYFLTIIMFGAAFFSSLYIFRALFLTFWGEERFDSDHVHPHESPSIMTIPLILLAIPALIAGFVGFPPEDGWIHDFLEPNFTVEEHSDEAASAVALFQEAEEEHEEHHVSGLMTGTFITISTILSFGGALIAYLAYVRKHPALDPANWSNRSGPIYDLLYNKYYLDEIYERLIIHPLYWISENILWKVVDIEIIDGTVNGVAGVVNYSSSQLRRVQTGFVANYALAIAIGAVIVIGLALAFQSDLLG